MKFVPNWKHFSGEKYENKTTAYVINLERRKDRLSTFMKNFPLNNVNRYNAYEGKINENDFLSPGAYGCARSHYDLWNLCVEKNVPIVIFEDDAQFKFNFNEIFHKIESTNFFNIDSTLFLGGGPRGFGCYRKKNINEFVSLKIPRNHWLRCECYIIFPKLASVLISEYKFHKPIDIFINEYPNIYMLNSEITYPGNSSIDSDTISIKSAISS